MFLKILQISQEKPCVRFSFNKVAVPQACNFIKKRLQHSFFPVNFVKFLRALFLSFNRTPPVAGSVKQFQSILNLVNVTNI